MEKLHVFRNDSIYRNRCIKLNRVICNWTKHRFHNASHVLFLLLQRPLSAPRTLIHRAHLLYDCRLNSKSDQKSVKVFIFRWIFIRNEFCWRNTSRIWSCRQKCESICTNETESLRHERWMQCRNRYERHESPPCTRFWMPQFIENAAKWNLAADGIAREWKDAGIVSRIRSLSAGPGYLHEFHYHGMLERHFCSMFFGNFHLACVQIR